MSTTGVGYFGMNYDSNVTIKINSTNIVFKNTYQKELLIIINYSNNKIKEYLNQCMMINYLSEVTPSLEESCHKLFNQNEFVSQDILPFFEEKSEVYQNFIRNIYFRLFFYCKDLFNTDFQVDYIKSHIDWMDDLITKISNLPQLDFLSNIKNNNIMIIGGNGSGKSNFASFLKEIYSTDMIIIPAQKILVFDTSIHQLLLTNKKEINHMQMENHIMSMQQNSIYLQNSSLLSAFSKVIVAIINTTLVEQRDYFEKQKKLKEFGKTDELKEPYFLFDKVKDIWNQLIPYVTLTYNPETKSIVPKDENNHEYNINALSDGQKVLLYYIGNILLASDYSYIVIDEPETHLNPSVYKKLWRILEQEKPNCQFIYISHDIEFIRTRKNVTLVWIKKYYYKNQWDFEVLPKNDFLPLETLIEIYGSKNKILFCEGNKENSLDYEIYDGLFDEYTVIPVDSCTDVIKCTEVFNKQKGLHNNEAVGLIDFDNRSSNQIGKLRRKHIYETLYNEIEMLLCDEEVLRNVLSRYPDVDEKVEHFKESFFQKIIDRKEKMVRDYIKNKINYFFENYRIQSNGDISEIKNEVDNFNITFDINGEYQSYLDNIQNRVEAKDFDGLLKYCNLKSEIVDGLGNRYISDYRIQATSVICTELKNYIREKYFSNIIS